MMSFNGAVLSDTSIKKYINEGQLVRGGNILPHQIQPNSVDLTLGGTYTNIYGNANRFSPLDRIIDPKKPMEYIDNTYETDIVIEPRGFILMASNEEIVVPEGIMGIVCGRSSVARMGIQVECAGLIDQGFSGTITLEVFNQTQYPIKLYKDMRIAQVYFLKAENANSKYSSDMGSKYNGQAVATGSRINQDIEFQTNKEN